MFHTLMIFVLALSLACNLAKGYSSVAAGFPKQPSDIMPAQSPKIAAEKLLDQYDQAWANHDVNQLLDFYDSSFVYVDVKGERTDYATFRKKATEIFNSKQLRNFKRKTTIKDLQTQAGKMVIYYEEDSRYESVEKNLGWAPLIVSGSGEATWQRTANRWKLVYVKELRQDRQIDPKWLDLRRPQPRCNYSYNGCR